MLCHKKDGGLIGVGIRELGEAMARRGQPRFNVRRLSVESLIGATLTSGRQGVVAFDLSVSAKEPRTVGNCVNTHGQAPCTHRAAGFVWCLFAVPLAIGGFAIRAPPS